MRTNKYILNFSKSLLMMATLIGSSVISFSAHAGQGTDYNSLEASALELATNAKADTNTNEINIKIPFTRSGDIVWSAVVGGAGSRTNTGYYTTQYFTDGSSQEVAVDDGSAQYFVIGTEARSYILNKQWLEGYVRATYNARSGGTTQYSNYSLATGRIYDPVNGLNMSIGLDLAAYDNYNGEGASIGVRLDKAFGGEKKTVGYLVLQFRK
jgi:hypothetical protein